MKATKFSIKTGEDIIVRVAELKDARDLLEMKLEYLKNTNTIPLVENEYPNSIELEKQLIERLKDEQNSVLLIAEHKGHLIGNLDLNGNQRSKLFHTGVVGMGIRQGWRGLGVGSALMNALLDWTSTNSHISILWLEVYDSNSAGKMLYEKSGFKECGRIKNFFQEGDTFIDKITMVRHL
ncbi:MAG: GNAT family N-acetyltransferase [Bacteroidota bacterium]